MDRSNINLHRSSQKVCLSPLTWENRDRFCGKSSLSLYLNTLKFLYKYFKESQCIWKAYVLISVWMSSGKYAKHTYISMCILHVVQAQFISVTDCIYISYNVSESKHDIKWFVDFGMEESGPFHFVPVSILTFKYIYKYMHVYDHVFQHMECYIYVNICCIKSFILRTFSLNVD